MNTSFEKWLNYIPVPIVVLDDKLNLVDASRSVFSLFRLRYRADNRAANLVDLGSYLMGKSSFVSAIGMMSMKLPRLGSRDKIRWKDSGKIYDVEIFTLPPDGEMCFGLLFEDVTRRIELERSREITRNYLEQMIDSLPLGIVVVDRDMHITALNSAQQGFFRMTGTDMSRLQAVGSNIMDLLPKQENISWDEVREQIFTRGEPFHNMEYSFDTDEGVRVFSVDLIPLLDKHHDVIGAMHITEEVTERRRLLADAQESEVLTARFDTLKQIVATLNHVVNNTLTGMICNIEVVRSMDDPISEEKKATLDEVMAQAHSIASFIQNLMDIKEIKTIDYLEGEKMIEV